MCQKAYLNSPAGRVSSGHTMKPMKMMMPTAIHVGFLSLATLFISSSSSTAEASSAPAFFTCTADGTHSASCTHLAPPSGHLCSVHNLPCKQCRYFSQCRLHSILYTNTPHVSWWNVVCDQNKKHIAVSWMCDSTGLVFRRWCKTDFSRLLHGPSQVP